MSSPRIVSLILSLFASLAGSEAGAGRGPVMREADVVFMYGAKDPEHLKAYGATWIAWGGGPSLPGIHSTGSFWCLTAGARRLHENPKLREAVARDIEGNPIKVPWLQDHVYEETPTWFGCTNHPAFRAHLDEECLKACSGKPAGIHIDDPSGTYAPASYGGGCFCGYCMEGFRDFLLDRDSRRLREEAGVRDFRSFDYAGLVRKRAKTKEEYLKIQNELPLRREFLEFQLTRAVENIRRLKGIAERELGRRMTISVNAFYSQPGSHFLAFVPVITHMVAEAEHHATEGTARLSEVIQGYRQASAVRRPFAATASGGDWAYVKEREAVNLVKIWIALSYACGQRLMVPHPEMQWCQTQEKGTHWYQAPVEEFAPLYRFVRANGRLFDGFVAAGPLALAPRRFGDLSREDERNRVREMLLAGDPAPLEAGENAWVFPRIRGRKELVVHLVNMAYSKDTDEVALLRDLEIRIPAKLARAGFTEAVLHRYDGSPLTLPVETDGEDLAVSVPELGIWGVLEFR